MKSTRSTVKLMNGEDVLKILSEQAPVGACIMQDGKFCYMNSFFSSATGYTADELVGRDSLEIVVPADREMVRENTLEMLKGALLSPYQFRVTCKDGSIIWVMATVKSIQYRGRQAVLGNYMEITERKLMEEALKEAEEEKSALLEEAPVGIIHTDLKGKITYVNKRFESESSYLREEIIGKEALQLDWFPAGTTKYLAERMAARLRGSPAKHWETQFKCNDGRWIWIELEGKVLTRLGVPVGFQIIASNITERKQAEEAVRQSEERYRTMLDEMEEGYYEVDVAGNFTFVNDGMSRILGYSRDELIGMNYKIYTPKEAVKPIFQAYNRVYRTGEPLKWFPMPEIRKDGTRILAEDSVFPLRNEKGEVIGFRGISRDITERKRAEEALRQSEERYRTILEETGDGYFETDLAGNFTFVNDAQACLLGCSKKEMIGVNYRAFTPEEKAESVFKAYKRMYKTGEPLINLPDEVIRKDGSHGFAETSAFPIRNDRGEIVGFRGVRRDTTARKQMEEALRHSEEKYRTILEETEDAYFEVDLGGHLTFVNNSVCRDLGYSKEELMGKSYKVFTVEDDIESLFRVFNDVYRTGVSNKGFPWKTVRKDGTRGFAETSISLLRNEQGETIGFRGVGRDITERKRAEEALNIQRAYFQQLFDTSPDAIIMMDTNDRTIQVNKGFEKLFGYSSEEAKGRSLIDLIVPEEDAQDASKSLEKILGGEIVRKERVRRRKDGSLVDVSVLAYPICFNGKFIGAYGIYTDITERRRQEQALADELTRRRLLIDQSLDGIVVLDFNARVVEANQRFAEMLGYTIAEVRELHTWDWDKNFPPEKILEMGRNVDEKGFHLETKHTRKDSSVIDVDISINGATCAGEKLIFCVCRDVTARRKMSEALELAAQEWRRTFDSISDAVSIHDKDFRIQRANKAFADLFGKSFHEIIGSHCYELHEGNEPRPGCPHQYTLTSGKPAAAEFHESRLGKYLLESTSPILNERGETVGAVHITRDITEQKRQNERLIIADRLASLGELAAGTAHELNNPLTSIIGFSQLLMEREVPDDIRENLKLISSEAQRAASVTRNLLTFARKQAPVKELNQINNIIEDVLKLRAHEHKVNCIEVRKHLAPDVPRINIDYYQMQQVFLNIVMNAEYSMIEAHKKGTLTVGTKKQNGSTVRISIADDGPGIPQENLGRIFDPFFTTKAAGKGTGLGLSICHGIVAEHGGQIYARSQPGEGAIILIELPINGSNRLGVAL